MDWTHVAIAVVTGLLSAGFVGAIFAGYVQVLKARHSARREDRGDETDVLQQSLKEARKDRDDCHREVRKLRDDFTAALVRVGRLEMQLGVQPPKEVAGGENPRE